MNKIKMFLQLDKDTRRLYIEAFLLLAWARLLKSKEFSKVAPTLGILNDETPYIYSELNSRSLVQVSQALQIMSRYTFWESECLVKAIAGLKMLERRRIESTLYFGVAKDENGGLCAHAWLRSGPYYISGYEGMKKFTEVSRIARRIGNIH